MQPFRLASALRENDDPALREEFDRLAYDFLSDAKEIKAVLVDYAPSKLPWLNIDENARALIQSENLDAPDESDALLLVRRAVRDGLLAGYREVGEIIEGRQGVILA